MRQTFQVVRRSTESDRRLKKEKEKAQDQAEWSVTTVSVLCKLEHDEDKDDEQRE